MAGHCQVKPLQETLKHSQAGLAQSLVGSLVLSPGSWCAHFVVTSKSLCFPILWKFCNQILLSFKVRFPGDSQFLWWIPRLGSMIWGLEPSQKCENFFGIIVLQLVDCSSRSYGIWFYHDCIPPCNHLVAASPLSLVVGYLFLCVGFSVLLVMVVHQLVANPVFSQEKMSACPSTPPSIQFQSRRSDGLLK